MKTLLLTFALSVFLQSNLTTKYDRFREETSVSTGTEYVDMKSAGRLEVVAYFSHKGAGKSSDGLLIGLAFYSSSAHWRFLRDNRLIAIVDGERVDFGDPVVKDSRLGRRVGVVESLAFDLERADLSKLASASRVEMQLGTVEFKLKDSFLRKLKELATALPSEK